MKKLFLLILSLGVLIMPYEVQAKSYNFGGYYCDSKKDMNDGTFMLTCHILATTDFEVNHIEGSLVLRNVVLKEIKPSGDWSNDNGLSKEVSFTSKSNHIGSFTVADLVFTGNMSDIDCEASFMPKIAEKKTNNFVCAIVDDKYYGKAGNVVSELSYYEECGNYVCTVIDNKYYFNKNGKSVSYADFMADCSITEGPNTGFKYGYIVLPLGMISLLGISRFTKKNTKIFKI